MDVKDCFGVVVWTIGLILALAGFYYFLGFVYELFNIGGRPERAPVSTFIIFGTAFFYVGLVLMRRATEIVNFAYPE